MSSKHRRIGHWGDHLVFDSGAKRKVPEILGSEIYEACAAIKAPCLERLRDEEIKELQNLLHRLWGWEDPDDADIVLGWIALAALGGFPNWRVHAYLSGPRGSGKSGSSTHFFVFGSKHAKSATDLKS